ncbi:MAG TPA: PAS domain-containing protein, partial [Chitinophagales bacterium]|nr:PAS domain-containing protein [Chitinophagales bacterium]
WDWNLMLNKTQWSAGYEKLFGYKLADAGNSDISQLRVHPDDRDRVVASIEEKLRAGESTFWECEYRYLRADGSVACVHDRGYVVHDESGQPVRIVGVMQDITQRKMAEAAQAEWQKRLAAIFTGTSDAILLANDAGHYIQVNPAASHMLGYSEEELLLLSVSDVIARVVSTEKDTSQWDTFRKAGHQSGVIELRCKDGSTISCHFNATANVLPGIHLSILTDITERISQEKRIRKSEALLQASQQLAHIGSWELCIDAETQTETLTWSDETFRIFGYEPHSITVNPELFYRHVRKDERAAVEANVAHAIANKTQMEFEHRIVRVDGVERVMLERADIHYGEDGKVRTVVGTVKDITERKHADTERERLTQELIDKNKGLEQFAYIVSHNLRSPVANIVGLSNILMRGDLQTLKRREMMESLNGAVDKLDNVIRDLNTVLQVKGTTFEKHEPVNLRTMLNDIVVSLDNAVTKENALVEMNLETDTVVTIRTYMYSVMQNLITNSLKYRRPDAQPLIQINSKTSCDKIIITYTDNGLGMNLEKVGDKVFGMYKRFHSHVEGKGMGLFMVKTQVETLGGKISISSKPNEGTQFTITLPQ